MFNSGFGISAHSTASCIGGMHKTFGDGTTDTTECCPPSAWNNAAYGVIKGIGAMMRRNELRVAHVFQSLLPDKIGDFAWDHNEALVDPAFLEKIARAEYNFFIMQPPTRWVRVKDAVVTPCGDYDSFYPNPVNETPEVQSILTDISGGDFQSWDQRRNKVIGEAPFSTPHHNSEKMPTEASIVLKVRDGIVKPTPWLSDLLTVYTSSSMPLHMVNLNRITSLKSRLSSLPNLKILSQERDQQLSAHGISRSKMIDLLSIEDGRWSLKKKLAVGAGAAAVVGAGAYLLLLA